MFKLLLVIIIFFGIILLLTGAIGFRFLRALFDFGSKNPSHRKGDQNRTYTQEVDSSDKIFGDHVGEYVEYEEIDTSKSPKADVEKSEEEQ